MTDFTAIKNQPIDGLEIQSCKIGSYLYAQIVHVKSGQVARKFGRAPINGGIRKFTDRCVTALSGFDWTVTAKAMEKDSKARYDALMSISYDA